VFLKAVKGTEYCLMQAGQHLVFFYLDNAPDIRPVPERDFKPMNDVSVKMCWSYYSGFTGFLTSLLELLIETENVF